MFIENVKIKFPVKLEGFTFCPSCNNRIAYSISERAKESFDFCNIICLKCGRRKKINLKELFND